MTARPSQIRAARALLDWSQSDLALKAGVSRRTITTIERGDADVLEESITRVQQAMASAGVKFVSAAGSIGVLLDVREE